MEKHTDPKTIRACLVANGYTQVLHSTTIPCAASAARVTGHTRQYWAALCNGNQRISPEGWQALKAKLLTPTIYDRTQP